MNKNDMINTGQIELVDNNGDLQLYSYTYCDNNSSDYVKQCRGIIFNNDTIIAKNFGYTEEYTISDEKKIESTIVDFSQWKFFSSLEGSIVRLYYFKDKWYLSTFKKIDAFKSKWGSKHSFGELFTRALKNETRINSNFGSSFLEGKSVYEQFLNLLDTKKQYMFLLPQKRVCVNFDFHKIYFVGTFENGVLSFENKTKLFRPPELLFSSIEELLNYVENDIHIDKYQGIICFNLYDNKVLKIFNSQYYKKYLIRGTEQSPRFRYLQLRNNENDKNILTSICIENIEEFKQCEYTISKIIKHVHKCYLDRYIKRIHILVYPDVHNILRALHKHYLGTKQPITELIVQNKINSLSAVVLNRLIKLDF